MCTVHLELIIHDQLVFPKIWAGSLKIIFSLDFLRQRLMSRWGKSCSSNCFELFSGICFKWWGRRRWRLTSPLSSFFSQFSSAWIFKFAFLGELNWAFDAWNIMLLCSVSLSRFIYFLIHWISLPLVNLLFSESNIAWHLRSVETYKGFLSKKRPNSVPVIWGAGKCLILCFLITKLTLYSSDVSFWSAVLDFKGFITFTQIGKFNVLIFQTPGC